MIPTLVVLDTETAALRGAPHLVEVGALRVEDGRIAGRFEALVRPPLPIDEAATRIHGISDADVAAAEPAAAVLARFFAWVGDAPLAAHNAAFDARVLAFEAARAGLALPTGALYDSLRLARRAFPEARDHKLGTLIGHLGIEVGARHRALADAEACWRVIEAALAHAALPKPSGLARHAPRALRLLPARLAALAIALRERRPVELCFSDRCAPRGAERRVRARPALLWSDRRGGWLEALPLATALPATFRLDFLAAASLLQ